MKPYFYHNLPGVRKHINKVEELKSNCTLLLPYIAQSLYDEWLEDEGGGIIALYVSHLLKGYTPWWHPKAYYQMWCNQLNGLLNPHLDIVMGDYRWSAGGGVNLNDPAQHVSFHMIKLDFSNETTA